MKPKDPILAALLNLIVPGLGCAYVGSCSYAILFFVWIPLAYLAAFFAAGFLASFIQAEIFRSIAYIVILLLVVFRILYEQVSTPYKMAREINQGNGNQE